MSWRTDVGRDGKTTALDVLVYDFLCEPLWYNGWKQSKGRDREDKHQEVMEALRKAGCRTDRASNTIGSKIRDYITNFKKIRDEANTTGQGTMDGSSWKSKSMWRWFSLSR
jgi:hypothetical protein